MTWFKMYNDFMDDEKLIALAFEDQRHFIGILALKSQGVLDSATKISALDRIVAQRLWINVSIITDVKQRLIDAELIDEMWQPLAWESRQSESSSADRVRKHRAKKKVNKDDVTGVTVTGVTCNAPRGDIEESKRREDKEEIYIRESEATNNFFLEYLALRKKLKLSNSQTVVTRLLNKLYEYSNKGHPMDDVIANALTGSWKDFYEPKQQSSKNPSQSFKQQDAQKTDNALDAFLQARENGFDLRNLPEHQVQEAEVITHATN